MAGQGRVKPGHLQHGAAPRSFPRLREQSSHQSVCGLCPWIIYDLFFTSDDHRGKLSISCSLACSKGSPCPPFRITPFAIKSGCLEEVLGESSLAPLCPLPRTDPTPGTISHRGRDVVSGCGEQGHGDTLPDCSLHQRKGLQAEGLGRHKTSLSCMNTLMQPGAAGITPDGSH